MAAAPGDMKPAKPIKHLRWYIGGLLFLSTVINYIDRQTLSVLAPYIKTEYQWTNTDFAMLIIAFRVAYAFGQTASGRLLDRIGTRAGLSLSVAFYSIAAMLTSLAAGLRSFAFFRFLLGAGESANWPGATKAVSEWFPKRESGWAVALFDSGSSIGGAIAPFLALWVYHTFGSWRPAFIVTGALGFLWLLLFRQLYRRPEEHPRLSAEEREYILKGRADAMKVEVGIRNSEGGRQKDEAGDPASTQLPNSEFRLPNSDGRLNYSTLLRLPQTWGIIIAKTLTDPVWFFITDWFAIYLVTKGFKLEESLLAFWVPFLAADIGNFAAGGFSSWLIGRGWSVGAARRLVIVITGLGMTLLIPTVFTSSYFWLVACFAISTLAYAALSTMVLNLPADIYPTGSVASVSGMSGTGAGIGTITATYLTGWVSDRYSFEPILVAASLIPLLAVVATLTLVRNNRATEQGIVNPI
jgi:ACS family hexuronate transporter-like MFS transporter